MINCGTKNGDAIRRSRGSSEPRCGRRRLFFSGYSLFTIHHSPSSGFTLLEVMVAVCLMAIGVVPLLVTHASTIRAFTRSKEITQASFIASSRLGILESQDREKEVVTEPGEGRDESYPFINWKSAVSSSEGDTLARADVTVQIAPEGVTRQGNAAALSTYLIKLRFKEEEKKAED